MQDSWRMFRQLFEMIFPHSFPRRTPLCVSRCGTTATAVQHSCVMSWQKVLSGLLDFGMILGIRAVSCTSPGLVGVSVLILVLFCVFLQCTLRLWILHGHHERDSAVFAAEVQDCACRLCTASTALCTTACVANTAVITVSQASTCTGYCVRNKIEKHCRVFLW